MLGINIISLREKAPPTRPPFPVVLWEWRLYSLQTRWRRTLLTHLETTAKLQPNWHRCGYNSFGKVSMGLLTQTLQGAMFPLLASMLGE